MHIIHRFRGVYWVFHETKIYLNGGKLSNQRASQPEYTGNKSPGICVTSGLNLKESA